jgi:hypothetical protein
MAFWQRKGGGYNTDSTQLSLPFIFVTFYGFWHRKGGRYNTDSTHLSRPFISITFDGFS